MSGWESGIFSIEQGDQSGTGGVCFLNGSLYYVCRNNQKLELIVCKPSTSGADKWVSVAPPSQNWQSCWTSEDSSSKVGGALSLPVVAMNSDKNQRAGILYVVSPDSRIYQLDTGKVGKPGGKKPKADFTGFDVISYDRSAKLPMSGATNVNDTLLVAWYNAATNRLNWSIFDPAALTPPLPSGFVWTPSDEISLAPSDLGLRDEDIGNVASVEWYTVPGTPTDDNPDNLDNPAFVIVTTFQSADKNPNLLVMKAGSNGLPIAPSESGQSTFLYDMYLSQPATLRRDPAGRIAMFGVYMNQGSMPRQAVSQYISTNNDPFGSDTPWTATAIQNGWVGIGTGMTASHAPAACFALGDPQSYNIGKDKSDKRFEGQQTNVYEVTLFPHDDDNIHCHIWQLGAAQYLPNVLSGKVTNHPDNPPDEDYCVVTGVIDSPIPIPRQNIAHSPDNKPNETLGTMVYGDTESSEDDYSTNYSASFGIKASFKTTAGVGPDMSLAMSAGFTGGEGHTTASGYITNDRLDMTVDSKGDGILKLGGFFASIAEFSQSLYRMVDSEGTPISGCPVFATIVASYYGNASRQMTPYLVDPGHIHSYTPEHIQKQAENLGLVDLGTDYIKTRIEANAMQVGSGGLNYLVFDFKPGPVILSQVISDSSHWTESGWEMDFSFYAGLSGGMSVSEGVAAGVDVSVTDEGFTFEQTSGISTSASHQHTHKNSTQIQLSLQDFEWPPAIDDKDIAECRFRIYYIPKDADWPAEYAAANPDSNLRIDPNSKPWRMFCMVESYRSKDGTIAYPPE